MSDRRRVAVVRETRPGETRVALVPELVGRLAGLGCDVAVEPGAGLAAHHRDADWAAAGAVVDPAALDGADVLLAVRAPSPDQVARLAPGALVVSSGPDAGDAEAFLDAVAARGGTALALERVPRTSRAQPADALTSQALVAGYRAVVVAVGLLDDLVPRTTTAAGTLPAARVLVLGTGVAGLQAVATARRLGADVTGVDVRPTSAEEVRSLGATFLDLGLPPLDGGWARGVPVEQAEQHRDALAPHVAAADVVVAAAAVPGTAPPVLVARTAVERMRPGAVVADLVAEHGGPGGGNVAGSVAGEVVRVGGALVWGGRDVAAQLPAPASRLLARNVVELVALALAPGPVDDLVAACTLVREGRVLVDPGST